MKREYSNGINTLLTFLAPCSLTLTGNEVNYIYVYSEYGWTLTANFITPSVFPSNSLQSFQTFPGFVYGATFATGVTDIVGQVIGKASFQLFSDTQFTIPLDSFIVTDDCT